MKLIRLTLKNFMPFKGEAILEFPGGDSQNTLIVLGDNMRGKTSLLNGIRWAFYENAQGRHLRPIPLHLMPNREAVAAGDWSMEARIEFEASGSRYDLRREARKKAQVITPTREEDFQVFAYMQKDGTAIAANEIDAEINKFAPEQVSRFFLFDGELLQEYEELLVEGSEQGKKIKEAIEQALGVPALTKGREDLHFLMKRAQKDLAKEASAIKGLEGLADSYDRWSAKRDALETDIGQLKIQLNKVKDERLGLEDEIERSEAVFVQKVELDAKVLRKSEIAKEIKEKASLKLRLVGEAWRDLLRPKILTKKRELSALQSLGMQEIREREKLRSQIEHMEQHLKDKICPLCKQPLDASRRESQEQELALLQEKAKTFVGSAIDMAGIGGLLLSLDVVLGDPVKARLEDVDKDLTRGEIDLEKLEARIDELEQELEGKGAEEIIRKRQQKKQADRDEAHHLVDIEDREKKLAEAERELQALTQRMNAHAGRRSTRTSQMASILEQMHSIFASSIDDLRSALRSTVETNASEAFLAMSTQKAYRGLSINANYGLTILGEDGASVPLRSAGAEQIVALSLIVGLSRSGRSAGPVVMDTPFGRLDTKHRKNILSYLPESASQFVLLVHDGEIGRGEELQAIAHRIGAKYEIKEISPSYSTLEKLS